METLSLPPPGSRTPLIATFLARLLPSHQLPESISDDTPLLKVRENREWACLSQYSTFTLKDIYGKMALVPLKKRVLTLK